MSIPIILTALRNSQVGPYQTATWCFRVSFSLYQTHHCCN